MEKYFICAVTNLCSVLLRGTTSVKSNPSRTNMHPYADAPATNANTKITKICRQRTIDFITKSVCKYCETEHHMDERKGKKAPKTKKITSKTKERNKKKMTADKRKRGKPK